MPFHHSLAPRAANGDDAYDEDQHRHLFLAHIAFRKIPQPRQRVPHSVSMSRSGATSTVVERYSAAPIYEFLSCSYTSASMRGFRNAAKKGQRVILEDMVAMAWTQEERTTE